MTRKTQVMYSQLWDEIRRLVPQMSVTSFMTDFEIGAMNSIQTHFPTSPITGCFFHLSQNVWRQIQNLGLVENYRGSALFAQKCRMLPALAMLPPEHVLSTSEELLIDDTFFTHEFDGLTEYFETNYIGRPGRRNGRAPALFAIPIWNVHERILRSDPKTNNSVEGFHRGMQARVTCAHPTVFKLIESLKASARDIIITNSKINAGIIDAPGQSSKYVLIATRLNTCVRKYLNGEYGNTGEFPTRVELFRNVSHNYEFDT